jgi:lipopolysaccharide transport system ATP-binding protein
MSDIAIRTQNLSKQYRLGAKQARYKSLRESLSGAFSASLQQMHGLLRGRNNGSRNSRPTMWALRDVSIEIKYGEVVGIIGRNGAGKSTLLKILSRITEPTCGWAEVRGRVGSLLEVGTGFHPELTGRENIFLSGAILGMRSSEIQRKFDEIVAFAEIEQFLDTPVKHYSSGMFVRLAFAVAAHLEPDILLVDEVLAVGDAAFQKKCIGKLGSVAGAGRTVLVVSHSMATILNLCGRAVLLDSGTVVCDGTTDDVVSHYMTTSAAANTFSPAPNKTTGGELVRIENFEVIPAQPQTGMPVEFHFTARGSSLVRQINAELSLSVLTDQGAPIFQIFSAHMGKHFVFDGKPKRIVAKVDSLPLTPGRYFVNLWLGQGRHVLHWLRECYVLQVETGRLPGGAYIESRGYPVVVPSQWDSVSSEVAEGKSAIDEFGQRNQPGVHK